MSKRKIMGYFHKENIFLDSLIFLTILCVMLMLFSLPLVFFGTIATDFECVRSTQGVECSLIRSTRFFKMGEIKIHNPIAVDINEQDRKNIFGKYSSSSRIRGSSRAEIRSKGVSYKINIYSGYDRQAVRAIAKEINEFLLSSNAPSFHKRF